MKPNNMTSEQFEQIMLVLNEIKELLKEKQTQTKITVVGNKAQTAIPKGVNSKEDFTL
jgi:hypothetical protein